MSHHVTFEVPGGVPIKAWVRGVPLEDQARRQLENVARLPIIRGWIAAMPDVHLGYGATIGSVIPTTEAIIPAAVGVDIGCGMMAVKTSLKASQLPDDLGPVRRSIEKAVPHGRSGRGVRDKGAWPEPPGDVERCWREMEEDYQRIVRKHPRLDRGAHITQLGTLGGGNHFVEVCLDESDGVWVMLHSGSRGVGNRIGTYFIDLARRDMEGHIRNLPDKDLAYLREGSPHFDDYVFAVCWAQAYARKNREIMMTHIMRSLRSLRGIPPFDSHLKAVNCHHNYVQKEVHFGEGVYVTRKGAVRAGAGELGIIPGSMGARSFIVRGKGNCDSFHSCSHGAGRVMSRAQAKRTFSIEEHVQATRGVECRKDSGVLDETPGAYKDIDAVMEAQGNLIEVVHTLKQVVCVKG